MVRFRRCFIPICFIFQTLGIFPRSRSMIKCEVCAFGEASALQIFGASWVQKGRLKSGNVHLGLKRPCLILDETVPHSICRLPTRPAIGPPLPMPFFDNGQGFSIDSSPMTDIAGGQSNVSITVTNSHNNRSITGEYRRGKNIVLPHRS
jgi:hypothetical protein